MSFQDDMLKAIQQSNTSKDIENKSVNISQNIDFGDGVSTRYTKYKGRPVSEGTDLTSNVENEK
ncbi:hypothetical protein [Clostridium sp. B9]|uniref:hypothetical protein n=1 Tax=Clostridium sp. B9 TaxID=3423224 RepID=UPI003D2EECCF